MCRMAVALIPDARKHLKPKNFVKAKWLAERLGITPQLAGKVLSADEEWIIYTKRKSKTTWIREGFWK